MSQPLHAGPGRLAARDARRWNLGGAMDDETGLDDSLLAHSSHVSGTVGRLSTPGVARAGSTGEVVPFHHFAMGEQASALSDDESLLGDPSPVTHAKMSGPEPARSSARGPTLPAPKKGEVLGGFRIVSELGRGAFARVYLAEQVDLGNRLVALKVSRAEGDEPQMLARLQHTHIVPIHSVHDDPETGLRLMCMPYLGGANLAQVLEAAGSRPPTGTAGRSLVDALDEVSQRLQSRSGRGPGIAVLSEASRLASGARTRAVPRGGPKVGVGGHGRRASSVFHASFGRGSLDRLNALWGRFTQPGDGRGDRPPARRLDARDFDQPARQFLREANTIQAAVWIIARLAEGLEHAHSRGLLHRDLKPSNILIAGDGTPMLLDFNLSTTTDARRPRRGGEGDARRHPALHVARTPRRLQPAWSDRARRRRRAVRPLLAGPDPLRDDRRAITRSPSRRREAAAARVDPAHLTEQRGKAPSLRAANPGVPWGLDSIVRKCLDPDPARRYARARDLAEDLNRFLDDLPAPARPRAQPPRTVRQVGPAQPTALRQHLDRRPSSSLLIIALGGLIGLLAANMQNLSTRLKLQVFRDDFAECRFLLNLSSGPAEHLGRGIALAQRTLDQQRIDRAGDWRPDSWVRRLTEHEQAMLREQTAELILLEARARVFLAERDRGPRPTAGRRWSGPSPGSTGPSGSTRTPPPRSSPTGRATSPRSAGPTSRPRTASREADNVPATSRDFSLLGTALLAAGRPRRRRDRAAPRRRPRPPRASGPGSRSGTATSSRDATSTRPATSPACIALEPKFAWPHMNRGLALARAGRLVEARDAYERALKANPRFAEAWLNLALVDLELNDLAAAERALGQALALGRREPGEFVVWAEIKARLRPSRRGRASSSPSSSANGPTTPCCSPPGASSGSNPTAKGRFPTSAARSKSTRETPAPISVCALLLRSRVDRARRSPRPTPPSAPTPSYSTPSSSAPCSAPDSATSPPSTTPSGSAWSRPRTGSTTPRALSPCSSRRPARTASPPRALDLLDRALDAGFPAAHAAADPDLDALRPLSAFRDVLQKPRKAPDASNILNAK